MLLALICALVANVSYGLGTVLQATGARRASTAGHLDIKLFARLARQLPYVAGLGLDAIGFVAGVVALRTLPLFVVQAAIAGSIGVTALTAVVVFGFRLRTADILAIAVLIALLGLLGASAGVRGVCAARPGPLFGLPPRAAYVLATAGSLALAGYPDPVRMLDLEREPPPRPCRVSAEASSTNSEREGSTATRAHGARPR